jgi:hypothetical protein
MGFSESRYHLSSGSGTAHRLPSPKQSDWVAIQDLPKTGVRFKLNGVTFISAVQVGGSPLVWMSHTLKSGTADSNSKGSLNSFLAVWKGKGFGLPFRQNGDVVQLASTTVPLNYSGCGVIFSELTLLLEVFDNILHR